VSRPPAPDPAPATGAGGPAWRAVVADTRPVVRAGLAAALESLGPVEAVEPATAAAAVAAAPTSVLVVGLRIDDPVTFPAVAAAGAADADLRVLVVADGATVIDLREAVIAGVDSFLLASAPLGEIRDAARATARGERIISPAIAVQLADTWRQGGTDRGAAALRPRELEVLQLLAEGLTNERIGERIGLSPRTVKTHVQHLLAKLGAADRTGAVARGFRLGLIR